MVALALARLNAQAVCARVNALRAQSPTPAHDSEPLWVLVIAGMVLYSWWSVSGLPSQRRRLWTSNLVCASSWATVTCPSFVRP